MREPPSIVALKQRLTEIDKQAMDNTPTFTILGHEFFGRPAIEIFHTCGLCTSKNEARRLVKQGGLRIGGTKIAADLVLTPKIARAHPDDPVCGLYSTIFLFWRGKKNVRRIIVDCGDHHNTSLDSYSFGIVTVKDLSSRFEGQQCSYGCCVWLRSGSLWKRIHKEHGDLRSRNPTELGGE